MVKQHPICAPYLLEYKSYSELASNSQNLVQIINYGDYHLRHKHLKNIPGVIKNLKLNQQPKLLKKLQKKYISLQSKKNSVSWKNKSSISLPKSLKIDSILSFPKSITVAGISQKKSPRKKISYAISTKKHRFTSGKGKKTKSTRKKYQIGGSSSPSKKQNVSPTQQPSIKPRELIVDSKLIPHTPKPKLLGGETFQDEKKKHLRSMFCLDFQLPDGYIQKLFFKVGRAPPSISEEVTLSGALAKCTNFTECNQYIYESNMYHTLNLHTANHSLHQNILDIFGFGYTFESSPKFIVKYDSSKKRIVGTHIPTSSRVKEIQLDIPDEIISLIQNLCLDLKHLEEPPIFLSYNISEYLDEYIPLKNSKKINTENKVVKTILKAASVLNSLYEEFGFVHGDLHDLNYLVKDIDISDRNSIKDIPPDFIKFYDFDLSMFVNHHQLKKSIDDVWIGNVCSVYSEIYQNLLQNNLLLFGKILSVFDFYRVFCNCSLKYPNGTSIFDFIGMTHFENVYLEELSDKKYVGNHTYFLKVMEKKQCSQDLSTEVLKLALEFKNYIIDNENNKTNLLARFTDEDYEIIKQILTDGFPLDPEYFKFTLPWWYAIWCIWTNERGEFIK